MVRLLTAGSSIGIRAVASVSWNWMRCRVADEIRPTLYTVMEPSPSWCGTCFAKSKTETRYHDYETKKLLWIEYCHDDGRVCRWDVPQMGEVPRG